ncbi:hypothetical protein CWE02_10460 [Brucella pituitosa]|nr:hypothetical protein CWE02_10460 [Brucella pituitosa]
MGYRAFEDGAGVRSGFCDPNSPWQKGAIGNVTKWIRRFFPGNTDLAQIEVFATFMQEVV